MPAHLTPHLYSVKLKVNKMTSQKTLLPVDYYRLPFCQPEGGPKMDHENLGEFLAGDRIESSPLPHQHESRHVLRAALHFQLGTGGAKGGLAQ